MWKLTEASKLLTLSNSTFCLKGVKLLHWVNISMNNFFWIVVQTQLTCWCSDARSICYNRIGARFRPCWHLQKETSWNWALSISLPMICVREDVQLVFLLWCDRKEVLPLVSLQHSNHCWHSVARIDLLVCCAISAIRFGNLSFVL